MNIRELLIVLPLAILTSLGIQYFFGIRKEVPTIQEDQRPLNLNVTFVEKKNPKKPVITEFETEHARYKFSTEGASLENVEFKRNWGGKEGYLTTIFPPDAENKADRAFFVALPDATPYYFDLVDKQVFDDRIEISYSAAFNDGIMRKKFVVYKNLFKIDLIISLEPKNANGTQLRMFLPAPIVPELRSKDILKGLAGDANDTITSVAITDASAKSWRTPTLFGAQDRYFVHACVADENNFIDRGYFNVVDEHHLFAILESPEVREPSTWTLSFYVGPKEDEALVAVDPRLEQTLNYGWFGRISRPVSKILLHILKRIYDYCHNYGIAIIILTFLMKIILFPFTYKSEQGLKKGMEYQKKMEHLQHKYKHDKEGLRIAQAELIRKHGIPGIGSCLPMLLLQMPLFIALGWVISNSIELFMAPFLWIHDLSTPDPYYILPVLILLSMMFHTPTAGAANDPKKRVSTFATALLFAAFATTVSAGLGLYLFTSTALGVAQAQLTKRFFS